MAAPAAAPPTAPTSVPAPRPPLIALPKSPPTSPPTTAPPTGFPCVSRVVWVIQETSPTRSAGGAAQVVLVVVVVAQAMNCTSTTAPRRRFRLGLPSRRTGSHRSQVRADPSNLPRATLALPRPTARYWASQPAAGELPERSTSRSDQGASAGGERRSLYRGVPHRRRDRGRSGLAPVEPGQSLLSRRRQPAGLLGSSAHPPQRRNRPHRPMARVPLLPESEERLLDQHEGHRGHQRGREDRDEARDRGQ